MTLINNDDFTIKELIAAAEKEQVWLPEFQRPFVWDKNQVRLLVDSLYMNYTISSILIWKGGDELARRRIGGSVKEIKIPEDKKEGIVYLLDGQQRTTALLLVFTNKPVYKWVNVKKIEVLNIWLDSEYEGDDPERKWLFDDDKIEDPSAPDAFISLKDYDSEDLIFNTFGHRFVKLKHVFSFNNSEAKAWFKDELQRLRFMVDYNEKLNDLKTKILARKVYHIEQKGSLEQVLDVFERINTKNTKLSMFDIMVAKTYRKFPERGFFDLRSYYKIINYTGAVKEDYFVNLGNINLDKISYILPESDLLSLTSIMLNKQFKSKEILKLTTPKLMECTKRLHDNFQELVEFLKQHFNIQQSELKRYSPMMKLLASVIGHVDIDYPKQELLKTWFWNTLLKNRYPGAQNERIERDFKIITGKHTHSEALTKMITHNTRSFDYLKTNSIENAHYLEAYYTARSQQIYRAMLLLLKSRKALDLYNGLSPTKKGANSYLLEEHHIFPKNSVKGKQIIKQYENHRYNNIINNIANIALLTKRTNNKRISNQPPSEYVTRFESEYLEQGRGEDFIQIMESQFITPSMIEMLKHDEFEEFMVARTRELYYQIELLCSYTNS